MIENLKEKTKEALSSVLPITLIVLALSFTLAPMEIGTLALFLTGAAFLILGMGFFELGAEMAMTPLGQGVGAKLIKGKSVALTAAVCFLLGAVITISEPDLQVLANQVASIPNRVLIWTVAAGVGAFTAVAVLRILFRIRLSRILTVLYLLLLLLSFFSPSEFVAVAFDAGGVTTGPMTVPFIMALGVGLSVARSDREGEDDSFGFVALCSIGPIMMVLLLGIFYHPTDAVYSAAELAPVLTTRDVAAQFLQAVPQYAEEVLISILPVIGVFLLFQLITRCYHKRQLARMGIGFFYTIVGLILFLTGVNVGFAPVGNLLGSSMAGGSAPWVLVPVGILIGYYIVKAEPAVQVLNQQVEELTGGTVSRQMMNAALSAGVSAAVALAMIRVLTGVSIYWIVIPGYVTALLLSRLVPQVFVGIAFDSGGVASGPMTSTFLLPLAMGACTAPLELLDILGLGGSGRIITICCLPKRRVADVFAELDRSCGFRKKGGGIAFTIQVTGVQSPIRRLLTEEANQIIEQKINREEEVMKEKSDYSVIWTSVLRGYSEEVVDTAREAGARGGTVIRGCRQNSEHVTRYLGVPMQEEQDLVVVVVPREKRTAVMAAISAAYGLKSPAHGTVISMPVDEVMGIE